MPKWVREQQKAKEEKHAAAAAAAASTAAACNGGPASPPPRKRSHIPQLRHLLLRRLLALLAQQLAARILASAPGMDALAARLQAYADAQRDEVLAKAATLEGAVEKLSARGKQRDARTASTERDPSPRTDSRPTVLSARRLADAARINWSR